MRAGARCLDGRLVQQSGLECDHSGSHGGDKSSSWYIFETKPAEFLTDWMWMREEEKSQE